MSSDQIFLDKFFAHIEANKSDYFALLKEAVSIPSVSAWPDHRPHVIKMSNWVADKLMQLGVDVNICDIGSQTLPDGSSLPLPPLVFGQLGSDPSKKTILIYGHFDVQPALRSDGWHTEPFELTEIDGKLWGRGSTDDKGPLLAWINAIEAYQKLSQDIPVNLKFCFEGMEESGSINLDSELAKRKDTFLKVS
jgi:nonspecific dipeptidase